MLQNLMQTLASAVRRFLPTRKRRKGDFVRRPRYKLQIVNQSSLSTIFSFGARRWHFIAAGVLFFIVVGAIWLALFVYTPLGRVLPVRLSSAERDQYVSMAARLDSITERAEITDRYAMNIRAILTDSLPEAEGVPEGSVPLIQDIPLDSLMTATEQERRFVEKFEADDRYNLSVLSPIAAEGMNFFPPVNSAGLDVRLHSGAIPSVSITPGRSTPVSAVYRGTVISTFYSASRGVTVVIQHPNEFISEYSGLAELFVTRGDKVSAGERIGLATEGRYPLTFELWRKGTPLDPTQYIDIATGASQH